MVKFVENINYDELVEKSLRNVVYYALKIVLQNQFENLIVRLNNFSVDLSFGGIPQTLTIPFEAITYFADPYAKFGLSFSLDDAEPESIAAPEAPQGQTAEVVSIDSFRKR